MSNAYGYARPSKLVCLSCRQNKIRCEPSPHAPSVACARCARKGLMCQYVPADTAAPSHTSSSSNHNHNHSSHAPTPTPSSSLPYTGPPPTNLRPRYSGGAYPDLSLAGQPSPSPSMYSSAPTNNYSPGPGYAPSTYTTMSNAYPTGNYNPSANFNYGYQP
ncbi:hypothetical protein C8F01DRAFT_1151747 [Mycena amicta]|nr:hypothetical protein C8F01DRAFT_1151747 [Mycena amicta]